MSHLVLFLLACAGGPAQLPTDAPADPPPAEPAPEPEPDIAEVHTVMVSFGKACAEPAEGEPVDIAQVEEMLKKSGIAWNEVTPANACTACGTCPRLAVEIKTTVEPDKVKAALRPMPEVPKDGKLTLDIGRKCAQPVEGAPTTVDEVLAAFEEAGIPVKKHAPRMACTACDCPEISLDMKVAPEDAARAMQLVHPWTPPKETGAALPTGEDEEKEGPKGSLP